MYKVVRRLANFPPHPLVHNASNCWQLVSEHETLVEARINYDWQLPDSRYEFAVVDGSGNKVETD